MTSTHSSILIDAIGHQHRRINAADTPRIVSLVPSITELLCDLGLAPFLVGRTGFCIHPKEVLASIPKIGGTKDVNIEKIRKLAPTHLIVNIDENEKPTVELLAQFVPHVIVTHPNSPQDNLALFQLLGAIFAVDEKAQKLCARLAQALASLRSDATPKNVLYCIWKDPWMTISTDTYIANMLALRGWQSIQPSGADKRYPSFTWDDPALEEVDTILLSTEPYRFTQAHAQALQQQVQKKVLLVDGEMLSWYGSRAILGLDYLAGLAV